MKIKTLGWVLLALLLLTNIWAILTEIFWLENITNILFYLMAVVLVLHRYKKFNSRLYIFLGFTVLSYMVRFFQGEYYSFEISLILISVAHVALILEAFKHIEIKNGNSYTLLYFVAIVGVNGCLLGYHVMEIKEYISSTTVFFVYLLYYINLLVLGIIAFIYYLNSYSKKSMFFISMAMGIIFADVLRDMGVFYSKDLSVEIVESIIRVGSAIFAVLFFATREKQLRLLNMI